MKLYIPSSALLTFLVGTALCQFAHASSSHPPLGLMRLGDKPSHRALDSTKWSVVDLSVGLQSASVRTKHKEVAVLNLPPSGNWSHALRGNDREVNYISFQMLASEGTVLNVAGVRLGITASPMPGGVQLMFDQSFNGSLQWTPLNYHVPTSLFSGRRLAPLSTITLRIDPQSGTWDLYIGGQLTADTLPLVESRANDRRLVVRAGSAGACMTGVVLADENPIYDDENKNGVDDIFERTRHGGSLLPVHATRAERRALAQAWRESQLRQPPPAFVVSHVTPDGAPSQ